VPELSRFYGIIIRMYVEAGESHHRPHFHAYYQEHSAVFAIDTIQCLGGGLPKPQERVVEAWVEIHRPNWSTTGSSCNRASRRSRSIR
jgi:Domain of unknown function (DUF4160)